jgi:cytochrome c
MNFTTRFVAGLALGLSLIGTAWASGATRAEAQAQVNAAIAHFKKVGNEQAPKDFNTAPEWKVKGMNLVLNDMKGMVLSSSLNEKLIGRSTWELKDPSGKEFVKDFAATAQKGEGWVDYQFINPETKKLEERSMFVKRVPGFEGYLGVAITK